MKIGEKLKQIILNHIIDTLSTKKCQSIDIKDGTKEEELLLFVEKLLVYEMYFVYKEGSTKFSDRLEVVKRENVLNYYSSGQLILFSLNKLDILDICRYGGYNVDAIEIITTGDFNSIVKELEKKNYGKVVELTLPEFIKKRDYYRPT